MPTRRLTYRATVQVHVFLFTCQAYREQHCGARHFTLSSAFFEVYTIMDDISSPGHVGC